MKTKTAAKKVLRAHDRKVPPPAPPIWHPAPRTPHPHPVPAPKPKPKPAKEPAMSTVPVTPHKPQTVTVTQEEAQTFKGFLKQLIVISRDGTWTEPDQRLRDLVDEVKTAFAKAAKASGSTDTHHK